MEETVYWVSKKAQRVKVIVSKLEYLSLIPVTHMVEGENPVSQIPACTQDK